MERNSFEQSTVPHKRRRITGRKHEYEEDIELPNTHTRRNGNADQVNALMRATATFNYLQKTGRIGNVTLDVHGNEKFDPYGDRVLFDFISTVISNRKNLGHQTEASSDPLVYGMGKDNSDKGMMKLLAISSLYRECSALANLVNSSIIYSEEPNGEEDPVSWALYHSAIGPHKNDKSIQTHKLIEVIEEYFSVTFSGILLYPSNHSMIIQFRGYGEMQFDLDVVGLIRPMSDTQSKYLSQTRHTTDDDFRIDVIREGIDYPHEDDINLISAIRLSEFVYINVLFMPSPKRDSSGSM